MSSLTSRISESEDGVEMRKLWYGDGQIGEKSVYRGTMGFFITWEIRRGGFLSLLL